MLVLAIRSVASIFSLSLMVVGAGVVSGQTTSTGSGQATSTGSGQAYPNKPIRMLSGGAGGGGDTTARTMAQGLTGPLGQPVIVDNRGSMVTALEIAVKAAPDGYTLLLGGPVYTLSHLMQETSYDPLRDFQSISTVGISPLILVVNQSVAVNSVKELIALAKAKSGVLNYASSGYGGATHLTTELFKSMAGGLNIVRINYKAGAPAITGLVGGETQMMIVTAATLAPHLNSGKLKALAVTSAQPSALAPGLPTVAETLPGFEFAARTLIVAPAKMPAAIIMRLNHEVVRVLNQPDVKQKLLSVGVEALGSTPEELAAATKADISRMGKVIKDAGIKVL